MDASAETFLSRASAVDRLNLAFLVVVTAVAVAIWPRLPHPVETVLLYAGLLALVAGAGRLRSAKMRPGARAGMLFVYTVVFLFAVFESLALVLPYVQDRRYDAPFAAADAALFGGYPSVWLERFASPWLTDGLSVAYFFYFPMPLILFVPMVVKGKWREVERWLFAFLVCYYGAYACYGAFPAMGPRFHLPEHATPLEGAALSDPIRRLIDTLEPGTFDAFPSLHAAILLVTLLAARRESSRLFRVFLPVAVAITVSLVYLRYHWVVDVVAGFLWAPVAVFLAGRLYARLEPRCKPHLGSASP